jgi:hypothetical protein
MTQMKSWRLETTAESAVSGKRKTKEFERFFKGNY